MRATESPIKLPRSFEPRVAREILDNTQLILASMIPGCTPRRYDFPTEPLDYSPIELCFADGEPIVPILCLGSNPPNCSRVVLNLHYKSLLRDPRDLGTFFSGYKFRVFGRLESGPDVIAAELHSAIAKTDLAGMIAAGAIDRLLAERPRIPVPWPNFQLAQCAIYLAQYDEARELLQDAQQYAQAYRWSNYAGLVGVIQTYLAGLASNPSALRQALVEIMTYNWSHFKEVSTPFQ